MVSATHLTAVEALAQKPSAMAAEDKGGFLPWLIMVGIIVLICFSAFLNPKRSHLG